MEKFTKITSKAIPLAIENIDTDQIIPARFLKATDKKGFGDNVFRDWRFHKNGDLNSEFSLIFRNLTIQWTILQKLSINAATKNQDCNYDGGSNVNTLWSTVYQNVSEG